MLEGQREDPEIVDRQEAAAAVELKCRRVSGFCLDGQPDGSGGDGRGADDIQLGPRGSGSPGGGHDVQVTQLPVAAQAQRCGQRHSGGQAGQDPAEVSGEDGQLPVIEVIGQPRQGLAGDGRLAVVLPVLIKDLCKTAQFGGTWPERDCPRLIDSCPSGDGLRQNSRHRRRGSDHGPIRRSGATRGPV
jgi:hypothetical protein